ncbi:MAG: hypothetical protein RO257_12930 [Candidatus Kapabacteria bacterium]|nr:hypothetical protein [Candidatus Kapabacteria bacterium]
MSTQKIADKLYVERYMTFCAGVWGEEVTSYLTDSTNFRIKIGHNDEHGNIEVIKKDNIIIASLLESRFETDTLNQKTMLIADLIKNRQYDSCYIKTKPIFGDNIIKCENCIHSNSYEFDDNYYISDDLYKCNNINLNAVYLTDSRNFRILIGIYEVGKGPNYNAVLKDKYNIIVYETKSKIVYDTMRVNKFNLKEIPQIKLGKVCK